MEVLVLAAILILAAVFAVSAIAKLTDIEKSQQTLHDFGVSAMLAKPFGLLLPMVEGITAVALLSIRFSWWGGMAALLLLLLFILGIGVNLARGKQPDCNCFGQVHSAPISKFTVLRNLALATLASFIVAQGSQVGTGVLLMLRNFTNAERAGLLVGVALVILFTAIAIYLKQILGQLQALGQKIAFLESLNESEIAEEADEEEDFAEREDFRTPAQRLPIGSPAPDFALPGIYGENVNLVGLLSARKPLLLFFFSAGCSPCAALLPELEEWQQKHAQRLTLAVISKGTLEENRRKFADSRLQPILVQNDSEVSNAYKAQWTPGAILIKSNGTTGSHIAYGAKAIREFLDHLTEEESQPWTAPAGKQQIHNHLTSSLQIGEAVPSLLLHDMNGKPYDIGALQGENTLLIFWSPDCGYCRMMADDLKAIEVNLPDNIARVIVISRGSVEANREMNLHSPILLDQELKAMSHFGSLGTPSAVIIDGSGCLASSVAIGATEIFSLLGVRKGDLSSSKEVAQQGV